METGGENGSRNTVASCAPATPPRPNLIFEDWIENYKDFSFGEFMNFAGSGTISFAVISPPPPPPSLYGIPLPNQLPYDLNFTPETNVGAPSVLPNILNFVPVTPEKRTRLDNSALVDTASKEIEKGSITALDNLAENPVDSLAAGNPENLDAHDIDMLKTPQQKQKRKKHRPKVIKEDKPKIPKTPRSTGSKEHREVKRTYVRRNWKENGPETPENAAMKKSCNNVLDSKEHPVVKRKYVRRNRKENGPETPENAVMKKMCNNVLDSKEHPVVKRKYIRRNRKENGPETPENAKIGPAMKKSCNRVLNFDGAEVGFNDLGSQTIPEEGMKPCPVIGNDSANLAEGADKESQGHYGHSVEEPKIGGINLQAYYLVSWPNSTKKRSAINTTNVLTSSATVKNGCESFREMNSQIVMNLSPNIRPTKKRTPNVTKARDLASLNRIVENPKSCIDARLARKRRTLILARKRRTTMKSPSASIYPALYSDQPSYSTLSGVLREVAERKMFSVDAIVEQLKRLDINTESSVFLYRNAIVPSATSYEEHNALVLHKSEGTVVPFEPIKKPRPRAKVDLDEETTRVWKLLLENINSEGIDGLDDDKAKYWEEERRVFTGRAESFIARMHLVQGDRRFSRWKGSVLDSVVGVFLTQNVSDHLSSSAFMSLAARFPLKSTNDENAQDQVLNNEETGTKETYESYTVEHCIEESDDRVALSVISQQQCGDSPTSQTSEKTGSCSENSSDESALMLENQTTVSLQESPTGYITLVGSQTILTETSKPPNNSDESALMLENQTTAILAKSPTGNITLVESQTILTETSKPPNNSDESALMLENQTTAVLAESPTGNITLVESQTVLTETSNNFEVVIQEKDTVLQENLPNFSETRQVVMKDGTEHSSSTTKEYTENQVSTSQPTRMLGRKDAKDTRDWDELKRKAEAKGKSERNANVMDSLDWEAVRLAAVNDVSDTIKERGMNNRLAQRIQDLLNRLVNEHGSTDLEWLRDVPPDEAKEYLLSVKGLGLKSVECVRLLTLHHLAFPVDTNVGRIVVRLGWVPLQPLPESLQLHLLEMYPVMDSIQKYLWPRLCKLDQRTLYELHYQLITFGKVFCTKSKPNCNSCPMRGECRHFASAYTSARLALPGPEDKSIVIATKKGKEDTEDKSIVIATEKGKEDRNQTDMNEKCEPIIEEPASPEPQYIREIEDYPWDDTNEKPASPEPQYIRDIEDYPWDDASEIPTIKLNTEAFMENVQIYMQQNMEIQNANMSNALVPLDPEAASIPMPKLKNVNRLRTEHQVYELPDHHVLLDKLHMEKREPDDPCPYLLAIWTPGETANSVEPPEKRCCSQGLDKLCNDSECFSCNSVRETNSQTVRGTFLIPCRTAMRGSFPLNGTYFQVNEMFADNDTSINPMEIPTYLIWNLPRRTVYFGSSVTSILRGLSFEEIQLCFWRGYVCVRAFDRNSRKPRPLRSRLHYTKRVGEMKKDE